MSEVAEYVRCREMDDTGDGAALLYLHALTGLCCEFRSSRYVAKSKAPNKSIHLQPLTTSTLNGRPGIDTER